MFRSSCDGGKGFKDEFIFWPVALLFTKTIVHFEDALESVKETAYPSDPAIR